MEGFGIHQEYMKTEEVECVVVLFPSLGYDVFPFLFSFLFLFYLPAKEKRNLCTAESAICAARGEERLDIAWESINYDSEDESVVVGMGWDG